MSNQSYQICLTKQKEKENKPEFNFYDNTGPLFVEYKCSSRYSHYTPLHKSHLKSQSKRDDPEESRGSLKTWLPVTLSARPPPLHGKFWRMLSTEKAWKFRNLLDHTDSVDNLCSIDIVDDINKAKSTVHDKYHFTLMDEVEKDIHLRLPPPKTVSVEIIITGVRKAPVPKFDFD